MKTFSEQPRASLESLLPEAYRNSCEKTFQTSRVEPMVIGLQFVLATGLAWFQFLAEE